MTGLKILASICAGLVLVTYGLAETGLAQDNGKHHHPRIHEVNHRLNHQNKRIDRGMKHGQLCGAEAAQLHSEDQSIDNQEMQDKTRMVVI